MLGELIPGAEGLGATILWTAIPAVVGIALYIWYLRRKEERDD